MRATDGEEKRSYQMALMVTFSPGVRSWGTNSQWQLLLSSARSSPGRLASKIRIIRKNIWSHVKEEGYDKDQREDQTLLSDENLQ